MQAGIEIMKTGTFLNKKMLVVYGNIKGEF